MKPTAQDLIHLVLSIGSLLFLSRIGTALLRKIGIPAVLGEILLGILIGPTVLGTVYPSASLWLFPVSGVDGFVMQSLVQVAIVALLFTAGMETKLKALQKEGKNVVCTALGSALIPFVTGFVLVMLHPALFGIGPDRLLLFASFLGVALSISALPVIIRILMDLGLYRSKVGMITVAAASLMDVLGWVAFTIILCWHKPKTLDDVLEMLWSHLTLLAFLVGILVSNVSKIPQKIQKPASDFVILFLSPLFFLSIGTRVHFLANLDLSLTLVIILVATASKLLGSFLGGRLSGLTSLESMAIGFALNSRGAMEIIMSKQALEAGLIEPKLFVALVIMALLTSMVGGPAVKSLMARQSSVDSVK